MPPDPDHLAELIRTYERRLHVLEQQIARFERGYVPAHLLLERDDLTAELTRLRGEAGLAAWAALPADSLPPVAPLPPGSQMPFSPNPLFVGREEALKTLARSLQTGGMAAIGLAGADGGGRVAAATGLGGIGKSQLAGEFAHRYGQFFGGVFFWLSLAEAAAVPAEVAAYGRGDCLNLALDYGRLDLPAQLSLVRAAWRQAVLRLLIFDNCEDEALLAEWRPTTGGCRVLLTSRRPGWDPALGVAELPLKGLPWPNPTTNWLWTCCCGRPALLPASQSPEDCYY